MEKDWYEVLDVPRQAKPAEIKAAYRALALQRHPDLNAGDPSAGESFMRVQAAYEVLGNPYRRARYDLARAARAPDAVPAGKTDPPRGFGGRLLLIFGAFLALKGFVGAVLASRADGLPQWLQPGLGREASFLLYLAGMSVVFYAAGLRLMRRD